jgi:hypothetical protein
MNRFFKINIIFNGRNDMLYFDSMNIEMVNGKKMLEYLIERRMLIRNIRYENEVSELNVKNYQSFGELKKKLCKKYCLRMML